MRNMVVFVQSLVLDSALQDLTFPAMDRKLASPSRHHTPAKVALWSAI